MCPSETQVKISNFLSNNLLPLFAMWNQDKKFVKKREDYLYKMDLLKLRKLGSQYHPSESRKTCTGTRTSQGKFITGHCTDCLRLKWTDWLKKNLAKISFKFCRRNNRTKKTSTGTEISKVLQSCRGTFRSRNRRMMTFQENLSSKMLIRWSFGSRKFCLLFYCINSNLPLLSRAHRSTSKHHEERDHFSCKETSHSMKEAEYHFKEPLGERFYILNNSQSEQSILCSWEINAFFTRSNDFKQCMNSSLIVSVIW